jgi:hypothetical protein
LPVAALFGVVKSSGIVGVNEKYVLVPKNDKPAGDMRRWEMRQYQSPDVLFEFKYVALADAGLTGEQGRALSGAEVKALALVQAKLAEARPRLSGYRQVLQQRYGARLRLRSYVVVALGFDRLAWEEV